MRFKLLIEYDGSNYFGWQRQADLPTIQSAIEAAIFRLTQTAVNLIVAGRTDAGVHAMGQVAHFDLANSKFTALRLRDAINAQLRLNGDRIAILDVQEVSQDFNARFSAKRRHYVYKILNRRAHTVLLKDRAWWLPYKLDIAKLSEAATCFVGKYDFSSFRSVNCQATNPIRTLDSFKIIAADDLICCEIVARAFLHNQVRSMVGSLIEVGRGKWPIERLQDALDRPARRKCGPVAPPIGLYLRQVDYD